MSPKLSRLLIAVCALELGACSMLPSEGHLGRNPFSAIEPFLENQGGQIPPVQNAARLPDLPLIITPEVQRELDHFTVRDANFIARSLERREEFYPMLVKVFREEGLPLNLINVALIESGFKPKAKSRAGAVGLWQFMKSTGRIYGLKITKKVDERTDPILSTVAAARHLRDLYNNYENWYLALAAYNAGSGGIDRAMVRARSDDFWQLCRKRKIRLQTARYVPRIIAATLIVNNVVPGNTVSFALNMDASRKDVSSGKASVTF